MVETYESIKSVDCEDRIANLSVTEGFFFSDIILLNYEGVSILKFPRKKWVLLRVVSVSVALCCKTWSIQNLPLGNASALVSASPIMICVFARIFLKEKINLIHIFAITAGLGG